MLRISPDRQDGDTPLHAACREGHVEAAQALLAAAPAALTASNKVRQ